MNLTNFVEIFTIESKLESICPYYDDMNALFGERQNFRPSYTNGNTKASDDTQPRKDYDPDDPDNDEYWADNDAHDPSHNATQATGRLSDTKIRATDGSCSVQGKRLWTGNGHDAPPAKKVTAANGQRNGSSADSSQPPRHFPATEKRLTPRKDFSSIYMDVQSQLNSLEREKFEYQKENDRLTQSSAAIRELQTAKASMISKLVESGVVDVDKIRELVAIAFPDE
ncbi:hypothetical protein DYB32_010147 [Aphanomyces invadans]|uniref:Uncharacterized protein n=1 Tax=Aphanomyces invadans TaxID=157072 RepID=A0A3R7CT75_9STRA|nr:hypothetical protein DYB32_010147 [Aphanomyces invadans]